MKMSIMHPLCALGAFFLSACNGDKDPQVDTGDFAFGEPDCHENTNQCTPVLRVDEALMRTCFGWNGTYQTYDTGTPDAVLNDCPNPEIVGQYCTLQFDVENNVSCENVCGDCIPLHSDTPGENGFPVDEIPAPDDDCCECDLAYTGLEEVIDALALCGFEGIQLRNCTDPDWILQTEQECSDGESFEISPRATMILFVDPLDSYVQLQTSTYTEIFALAGGGSARLSTERFLTATVWAEDGTLGSYSFSDWAFWATSPIDYDINSGTFTVQSEDSPLFRGHGYIGSVPMIAETFLVNDAAGQVYPSTHTWQVNYSFSGSGDSISVHLEGSYEDVP